MVVVLVGEDHGVDRGEGLGLEHARRVDAAGQHVHLAELLLQQRIDQAKRALWALTAAAR